MPWTATFAANFEPFDRQLDQASASLGQFEQDTKKVERSLQRMVSEFDGTKVSQQAQSMAAAVDKIGGAAKLTEAEQRKLNATVTEAMAKYRSLGVEAPASVQKLSRELQDAAKSGGVLSGTFGQIKAVAAGVFAGLGVAAAVQGIQSVASSAVNMAGKLTDLSAQSGIAASSLDRMRLAAAPAGVEIETVTNAVAQMSDKLVSGDKSAIGAIARLGLDLNALKASKPDAAFLTIVDAIGKIPDPMERAKVAFDVFSGRSKEVLRITNAEFVENARQGNAWSEEEIAALDAAGDAWQELGNRVILWSGRILSAAMSALTGIREAAGGIGDYINGGGTFTSGPGRGSGVGPWTGAAKPATIGAPGAALSAEDQRKVADALARVKAQWDGLSKVVPKALDDTAKAADRANVPLAKIHDRLLDQAGWDAHVARLQAASAAYRDLAVWSGAAAQGLQSAATSRGTGMQWATQGLTGRDVSGIANAVSMSGYPSAQTSNGFGWQQPGRNWGGMFNQVPSQLVSVFSAGGGSRQVGGGLGSIAGGLGGTLAASGLGFAAGSFLGSAIPVLGTLVGGFLGRQLGGLFGPSRNAQLTQQSNANISQTQAGLLQQYGSVQNIAGMGSAGDALAAAWGSKGQAGEQWFNQLVAAFERQNQLLDEQTAKQATLNDLTAQRAALEQSLVPTAATVTGLMQQYGIEIDGAGQKVQQLVTTADFEKLINDMQTLERAGIDTGGMLSGMADEISNVVQRSIKFGTEIPANMRPYIESLAKAGRLTDENGEAITDLSQIKFGAPVETEAEKITKAMDKITDAMQPVVDRLKEIADLLARGIPAAAQAGADGVDAAFRDAPTGSGSEDSRGYAAGDVVYGTRRAWIGEGGQPEIVGPVSFMARALAGAMAMQGGMAFAGAGFDARVAVPLYLHERELGRAIIDVTPKAARWAGVRLPRS